MKTNGEYKVMQKFLPPSRIVFDVGVNVGSWTKHAITINHNLSIHCFEPSQYTYKKLLAQNFPAGVVCNNFGLSSTKKLDSYCEKNNIVQIDFLKMDIEGHELEAFHGGTKMFRDKKIKIVQFEYGGCNIDAKVFLKDIFAFLKQYDYKLYKIYPNEIRHVPEYSQELDNFQYQNWLAKSPRQ